MFSEPTDMRRNYRYNDIPVAQYLNAQGQAVNTGDGPPPPLDKA